MNPVLINGERTDKNGTEAEARRNRLDAEAARDTQAAVNMFTPFQAMLNTHFKVSK